jgi:hypothetical protein
LKQPKPDSNKYFVATYLPFFFGGNMKKLFWTIILLAIGVTAYAQTFSVKYQRGDDTYIITSTEDRNIRRLDIFQKNGTHNIYIRKYQNGQMSGMRYEDGRWEDSLTAVQTIDAFSVWISLHLYYKDAGFTNGPNIRVAGQDCRTWAGTQGNMRTRYADLPLNAPAEIAVWNNAVTMRLKSGNTVLLEAAAFSVNVPDTAFTQTVDVTWIK